MLNYGKVSMLLIFLVLLVAQESLGRSLDAGGCSVRINSDLGDPQTLVLRTGELYSERDAFYYPIQGDEVYINQNEVVLVACPGGSLLVNQVSQDIESQEALCDSGVFKVADQVVNFADLSCSKMPVHTARYTGESCLNNYREIETGFLLSTGKFLRVLLNCFDDETQNSLNAISLVPSTIEGYQSSFPRPGFVEDDFYHTGGIAVDKLYTKVLQRETLNRVLGLPFDSTKYFQDTGDYYLSRGHLSPKADFVYGSQQSATFHFVNVAPQWQTFNGGNWVSLETNIRDYVTEKKNDYFVFTGTYGIATLPHEQTGEEIELFLYINGNERGLAVPQYYWKVLYNPVSKEGIAFVGANNPYVNSPFTLCTDICAEVSWLTWKATDQSKGFSYCCDVNVLRKVVNTIPYFEVSSVLT